jgi:hypothetical protein
MSGPVADVHDAPAPVSQRCVEQVINGTRYVQVEQLVEGGASELNGVQEGDVLLRIVRLIAI